MPSHRILALFRGEKEEVLTLELMPDAAAPDRGEPSTFERQIANRFKIADHDRPADRWLIETVRLAWRTRILAHIESDLRLRLWQAAEDAAVQVFAGNLRDLLLAAPAGARTTMGLDPGYRTGVKVAVVIGTGQVAATTTIYPHEPQRRWDELIAQLARLAREHRVELIAIGNGTASRETDRLERCNANASNDRYFIRVLGDIRLRDRQDAALEERAQSAEKSKSGSHVTYRWRETDLNFWFRT